MNKLILCAVVWIGIILSGSADAKSVTEKQRHALDNLHQEIIDCALYFHISSEGVMRLESDQALTISHRSTKWKDHLISIANEIRKKIGMSKRAMNARSEKSFESQMAEIDNDFANYNILLRKRLKPCAELIKNLDQRIDQAMKR